MKFAIILAGCGQHDGSETHEVVLSLLAMTQENVEWEAFAPDIQHHHICNHLIEEMKTGDTRSVLEESSRLVRGKIKPITSAVASDYDAIVFPGGAGAVSNLCDWFDKGEDFSFQKDVENFINSAISSKIPMGFICIAPILITKIYSGSKITIGNDDNLAKQINNLGSEHVNCSATDIVVDSKNKIVSTPANMVAKNILEVQQGIHKLIKALVDLASK